MGDHAGPWRRSVRIVSRMDVNAWGCTSFGDTSPSINAIVMNGSPNLENVPPAFGPAAFVRFVWPRSMTAVFRAQDTGLHIGVLRARARFKGQVFYARCCKGCRRRLRGPVGDESAKPWRPRRLSAWVGVEVPESGATSPRFPRPEKMPIKNFEFPPTHDPVSSKPS